MDTEKCSKEKNQHVTSACNGSGPGAGQEIKDERG